jgi:formylmethanofuran dehydrogenase subunit E
MMRLYHTDNPVEDFERYDADLADEEEKFPICDMCGERMYEHYYNIDGNCICSDCLDTYKVII